MVSRMWTLKDTIILTIMYNVTYENSTYKCNAINITISHLQQLFKWGHFSSPSLWTSSTAIIPGNSALPISFSGNLGMRGTVYLGDFRKVESPWICWPGLKCPPVLGLHGECQSALSAPALCLFFPSAPWGCQWTYWLWLLPFLTGLVPSHS